MSKDNFKIFVKAHPELIKYVNSNQMTWQKFYDMYDLYGEDNGAWSKYLKITNNNDTNTITYNEKNLKELVGMIKKVDLQTVQKGVSGMQKAIGLLQELGIGKAATQATNTYEPRPMYKYFDD